MILTASTFATKLGLMTAVADTKAVYLVDFVDAPRLQKKMAQLCTLQQATLVSGTTAVLELLQQELDAYFDGRLTTFTTPVYFVGSPFQEAVWQQLIKIPYGAKISYAELAKRIGKPSACRAVAQANGANKLSIIVACHRVVAHNGSLGGYAGGLYRKQWLLEHEKKA